MDAGTGLTILGGAVGSKELVQRILGPTADYLGAGMKDWTQRRVKNLGRIFESAKTKLGEKLEAPGAVPPKVLKGVLEEGSFCDDELTAEYFGGVLASSRTERGRDDRGSTFISLLGRLSTYQIRSHFVFYSAIRGLYEGLNENLAVRAGRKNMRTFIPALAYRGSMEFAESEDILSILQHVMFGLGREQLIGKDFVYGSLSRVRRKFDRADSDGIVFSPAALGAELYLWSHGKGGLRVRAICDSAIQFDCKVTLKFASPARSVKFPDRAWPEVVEPING